MTGLRQHLARTLRTGSGWWLLSLVLAGSAAAEPPREYLDRLFSALMEENEVPGLAVVVVQNGATIYRRGFGWADVSRRSPVEVDRTLFPLGSLSKILTTVAALQLVEAGRLDLDTDVNRYLGPGRIDRRFPAPVTLRNLLTHTDGLDVRWLFGGAARVPNKVRPLATLLAPVPPRVLPPGEIYLYGDVGMTLAGYLVERVSEEPFADYMERHVLTPLGMRRTSFRADRPSYARDRATGYDYDLVGRLSPVPPVYPHAVPASGVTGPVADMGPFMLALLNPARNAKDAVLGETGIREMSRLQFSHDPAIAGTSFGFYEYVHRGRRALVHGGLLPGFTSVMMLLPSEGLGVCVAANRFDLIEAFERKLIPELMDHFATTAAAAPLPAAVFTASSPTRPALGLLDGDYRCDQYSRFSTDKLAVLAALADEIRVITLPDGRLRFTPAGSVWRQIGPFLYEDEQTGDRVAFRVDGEGRASRIVGSAQFMSYHRLRWFEHLETQAILAGASILVTALAALRALWAAWHDPRRARIRGLQRLLAIGLALSVTGYVAALWFAMRRIDFATAAFGEPPLVPLIRYVPALLGIGAIGQLVTTVIGMRSSGTRRSETLSYAVGGIAVLILLPLMDYWNLLRLPFSIRS